MCNNSKNDPLFKSRLDIQPIPNFSRAIFLAAPHRGTEFADRWFTLAARKSHSSLPGAFFGALAPMSIQSSDPDLQAFVIKDIG